MQSAYELVVVQSGQEWEDYHRIRRVELFEAKGRFGIYDPTRPEEHFSDNVPLLLKFQGVSIGTTRLDFHPPDIAIIRLVAITHAEQGKGHGKVLLEKVEAFAVARGVKTFFVNAAPTATGFYEKFGFFLNAWDPSELIGISKDQIQMSKML